MKNLFSVLAIVCLGAIVYSNSFDCSFHFDDFFYIIDDPYIRSLHNLLAHWQFYSCRFITLLSILLNYHFNGLNVFGYHLFNLTVHLGVAILVWWLTLLTLSTPAVKKDKITKHANLIALFAGLIFVSHPIQTEAVTYIWQRSSSMVALFYLASLCLYVKSRLLKPDSGQAKFCYILSLIMTVVAMFTKENAVTLPLMILLYEFSFLKENKAFNWRYLSPFLLTLLIIPLTILSTTAQQFHDIREYSKGPEGTSSWHYLLTQFRVICTYIRLLFLPIHQNLDYDYSISKSIFEFPTFISFLFLAGILFLAKRLFSRYRLLSFSILWFFGALSLESSLFPLINIIFEHRLYLPLAGYSIFLVSGVYYGSSLFYRHSERSEKSKVALALRMTMVILTIIISCNSFLTYQRNKVWKNEITLLSDAARKSPHKARLYHGLGLAYTKEGDFVDALANFNKALAIVPDYGRAYNGRGSVYYKEGNFAQALSDYTRAAQIDPTLAEAFYNLGIFYDKQGNFLQALPYYNQAIKINPDFAESYYNRGNLYARQGNFTQAIQDYTKAIELNPLDPQAYTNRGNAHGIQGDLTQALSDYNKAITIDPNYAAAYNDRAVVDDQLKNTNLQTGRF